MNVRALECVCETGLACQTCQADPPSGNPSLEPVSGMEQNWFRALRNSGP